MPLTVKQDLRIQTLASRAKTANSRALYPVLGLVQRNSQYSMRRGMGPSFPGTPPNRHVGIQQGLGRIRFQVTGNFGIIGPVKLPIKNPYNETVPRINEVGGLFRSAFTVALFPERSFMYRPTLALARSGAISRKYAFSIGRFL